MRLINLHTFELREFIDSERPPYVILSHTWGPEEVTLQQLKQLPRDATIGIRSSYEYKAGYLKIRGFAREGRRNGFEWGWVDTCCIDKSSSSELSEAINSMLRWYEEADSCYAYLSDVPSHEGDDEGLPLVRQFAASRWFTRGWTLQELLAPSSVIFYLNDWTVYGTKNSLRSEVSTITHIPKEAIKGEAMTRFNIGKRISWVSRRQTTRPEDLSYCLLGILNVNMPLLYGEGTRAFMRLQEEVLKSSTDSTIFAWPSKAIPPSPYDSDWLSPLAPNPSVFAGAGKYRQNNLAEPFGPWKVTNRGLRLEGLPVVDGREAFDLLKSAGFLPINNKIYVVAMIGCVIQQTISPHPLDTIGIVLYRDEHQIEIYYRQRMPESLLHIRSSIKISKKISCIIQLDPFDFNGDRTPKTSKTRQPKWILRELPERGYGYNDVEIHNLNSTESEAHEFNTAESRRPQFIVFSNIVTAEKFLVRLGLSYRELPFLYAALHGSNRGIPNFDHRLASDQFSLALRGGNVAVVSLVPGVRNGNKVLFVDVSIRDDL